jgi:hypothetical protein
LIDLDRLILERTRKSGNGKGRSSKIRSSGVAGVAGVQEDWSIGVLENWSGECWSIVSLVFMRRKTPEILTPDF